MVSDYYLWSLLTTTHSFQPRLLIPIVVLLIQHQPSILFRDPTAEHHFHEDLVGFARPGGLPPVAYYSIA
ncbi:hypothetical protein GBA52_015219 [Prunus armeniaca]|nr:hypothetical protein GBA52_015219 [Prunus armeniaca]